MNNDIRLSLTFRHHRKRKRLFHRLGSKGVISLIDLWCTAAEQYSDGCFKNYTKEDIEIDAGWDGEPGEFFSAIIDIGFLDESKNGFCLHNWHKHQVWVSKSEERSNISRLNIMSKKHNRVFKELQALGIKSVNQADYALLTDNQVSLKQRLADFKHRLSNAISDASKNGSDPKPNALLRYPLSVTRYPKPINKKTPETKPEEKQTFKPIKKKNTPAKSAGTFTHKNKNVKNSDYSINLSDVFLNINNSCKKLFSLPAKKQSRKASFNPEAWAQKMVNNKKHPGAILKCLDGLIMYWDTTGDPWGYCTENLKKYNGNFNEQESIAIHEDLKNNYNNDQLAKLTAGLIKEL